jgi:predicted ferric reductase
MSMTETAAPRGAAVAAPTTTLAQGQPRPRPLALPKRSALNEHDLSAAIAALALCVVGLWVRHGGLSALTHGWEDAWTSLTQLTGLLGSTVGLVGVLLAARPRSIERWFGLDRLLIWHRYLGETMAVLIAVHVTAGIAATVPELGFATTIADMTGRQPYMAGAAIGAVLIGIVTVSSLRSVRHRLSYETWYFVHLTAYLGFALSFGHEIALGGDLADDRLARTFWVGLHVAVAAAIVFGRWGHVVANVLRPLRVTAVDTVGADTVSITVSGRHLTRRRAAPGQFFMVRPLQRDLWWQAHPFSLSAAPSTAGLRFTVKSRGDASAGLQRLPIGARVAVEGPYGACTPDVIAGRRPLFVVGGVGVAPARAMIERLASNAQPIVLYRAHSTRDLVHLDELRELCATRNGKVLTLVGPTASLADRDPFSARHLRAAVPDLTERVAVLCGPERLLVAARSGLIAAGISPTDIHFERPWW